MFGNFANFVVPLELHCRKSTTYLFLDNKIADEPVQRKH